LDRKEVNPGNASKPDKCDEIPERAVAGLALTIKAEERKKAKRHEENG